MSNWKPCPPEQTGMYWFRREGREPCIGHWQRNHPATEEDPLGQRGYFKFNDFVYPVGTETYDWLAESCEYQEVEKWRE